MTIDARAYAEELRASGSPFVLATVVRAARPTSAKPGARAVVRPDGTIVGFVGGECAEASVRAQALATLATGEPVLLRIVPDDAVDAVGAVDAVDAVDPMLPRSAIEGVVTAHNPCLSGGTLEVFLEPTLPAPRVTVRGRSPIALAFAGLARHLGYAVDDDDSAQAADSACPVAMVVASHGDDEAAPLVAAVRAGVPYVGLVASRRRGAQVLAALDITDDEKARIHTPAGLDIKARTPQEVAVSIMAEIIASRATEVADAVRRTAAAIPRPAPATAVDPVCGMTVAAVDATLHADTGGIRNWFCGAGCRDAFLADPAAFSRR
jgi:xanthine dehydrogenase accessory factor